MLRIAVFLLCFLFSANTAAADYRVLFTKQAGGTDNLYMLHAGDQLRQITTHRRKDSSGTVSPNGGYIAFTSERDGWWKI